MKTQRYIQTILVFCTVFVFTGIQRSSAQTDLVLYNKYVEKQEPELSSLSRSLERISGPVYEELNLSEDARQQLNQLIVDHHQAEVLSVFLVVSDTSNLDGIFKLLRLLPNLEALHFYDGQEMIKRKYQLPQEILQLRKLKVIKINGARNLDVEDTFDKLRKMTGLRGVDLLDYTPQIPSGSTLPDQIAFVKLSTPQLQNLNTTRAAWRMARIEQRGEDKPKDEALLEKLADLNSLEVLSFQFCYIKDGAVFRRFSKLNTLKIHPVLAEGCEFIRSLSVLKQLKSLGIYQLSDTSQSLSGLEKFSQLEALDLRWISRYSKHPDELMSIGKLTKLRSLIIQSCYLSTCPDFFKPLSKLESVTLKWDKESWTQNTSFSLPDGLYQLPELKKLTIWKTISQTPSLKSLPKLQYLDLSSNNLKSIPEGITGLKDLKTITLTANQLIDLQTQSWEKLTSLKNLDLSRNQISSFPQGVQHLLQLQFLNLSANKITSFPSLEDATYQMKILSVDYNKLERLPDNLHHYQNLQTLTASYCDLPALPEAIGALKQLKILNLEGNNLKTLPKGLADNLNLHDLNLKNNRELDQNSIYNVVLGNHKKRFLMANLDNTGLKVLPANVPWEGLEVVLDLSNNQLKTLPGEMGKMKWFNVTLKNNPLALDTGFIDGGIKSPADAKLILQELGQSTDELKVSNQQLASGMIKAVGLLSFWNSFEKAVRYAEKAKSLDPDRYNEEISWYAIGIARFKTKDYKNAITDLNMHLQRSTYPTWWRSRLAKETEAALAESYLQLGEKKKAADIHSFFADKSLNKESTLNAALSYLELGDKARSKKYFETAVALAKEEYLKYPNIRDIYIYNYAEVLLMAEKPDEVLNMLKSEDPKISESNPAYKDYLESVALLMVNPGEYSKVKNDYIKKIAINGKVKDWDYSNFNRWVRHSGRPDQQKQHLYELEALNN